jgi:hypothetical protein
MHATTARSFAALLFTLSMATVAATPSQRHFVLPNYGSLDLAVPSEWTDELAQPPGGLPPTIQFGPRSGPSFQVLVSPGGVPAVGATVPDDAKIRAEVAATAKAAESQSVEKSLPLKTLTGPSGSGYYFVATDRAPAPGEWKYLTQGIIRVDNIVLAFTILTNDGQEATVTAALEMLRHAAHNPSGAADSGDSTIVSTITRETIELTVPGSAILLRVPKGDLAPVDVSKIGAQTSPRYFYFGDSSRGLAVSGWFESARSFKGIEKFWVGELSAMKRSGLMPKAAPTVAAVGEWVATAYDIDVPSSVGKGVNTHIRAELIKAGTWVDLHISITAEMPLADARSEALEFLKSIEVIAKE